MDTKILKIDLENIDTDKIAEAAQIVKTGGIVAFPTETVYGLGGDAQSKEAARKIYEAKGRPSDNPLIVHIERMQALETIVLNVPEKARQLADAFWPGPLTMIFRKNKVIPYETTGGLDTVAVRMPSHPVALALIRESGGYIAAPSANASGRPSPTLAKHVWQDLEGKIPLILDGGQVGFGIESTILDFSETTTKEHKFDSTILRPGSITKEMIESIIGPIGTAAKLEEGQAPKAPGMKYRHYSPKAELILVSRKEREPHDGVETQQEVALAINDLASAYLAQGKRVGILATKESKERYPYGLVKSIGSRSDKEEIARNLYKVLREFDDLQVEKILSETFWEGENPTGVEEAIRNRLKKAAAREVFI